MNKTKALIFIAISFLLSIAISFINIKKTFNISGLNHQVETKIVQNATEQKDSLHEIYKLYYKNELIAIITNYDNFINQIQNYTKDKETGLISDAYIVKEKSYFYFDNKDDEIIKYVYDNNYIGVVTNRVDFLENDKVYETIYVNDINDFEQAKDEFIQNFVSKETLLKVANKVEIEEITDYGSLEYNVSIKEKIKYSKDYVNEDLIFNTKEDIYNFLAYGRDTERSYYIVKDGDTLSSIAYVQAGLNALQLYNINKDKLVDVNQILIPGTQLTTTYFKSPITVNVTKHRLAKEDINPENALIIENPEVKRGEKTVLVEEEKGLKNVLYEEQWVNGVLMNGKEISTYVLKDAVRGQIEIGTNGKGGKIIFANDNFIWPIDNPNIVCAYGGYAGHVGNDFQNIYDRYGDCYAMDSGVVISSGYKEINGNYVIIDHLNGYKTYYGHFNVAPYVQVGDVVQRGEIIGQIGQTGYAFGAHVHMQMWYNDKVIDACDILDCYSIPYNVPTNKTNTTN